MLFSSHKNTPGCLSVGLGVCVSFGYNGKKWSL